MPGDLNSTIGYLDVQFGAMDFMSDSNSFDAVNDNKYGSTNASNLDSTTVTSTGNMDLNAANQNSTLDAYSPKSNTQSSISSALTQSVSVLTECLNLWLICVLCSLQIRIAFHKQANT